ncbi:MAG: AAA family ATPase [Lachnospiraceae bacterium]|nr:AAA family ATPase [Lachnospiraceae bacterium]
MNLSKDASAMLRDSITYAVKRRYEYVTPEILLLMLCDNEDFKTAFKNCGGDIEVFKKELKEYGEEYIEHSEEDDKEGDIFPPKEPELSIGVAYVLAGAGEQALSGGRREIGITHIINAIWQLPECYGVYYMEKQGVEKAELLKELAQLSDETILLPGEKGADIKGKGVLAYAPCINDMLEDVNPLIGREEELERTIQILCRRDKNNPLHIGEPGVGKTSITYGLAQRINEGRVPDILKGSKIFALDLGGMLAGTQYRGDFENRFKKVLSYLEKEDKPIVYIDEIHNISGAGAVGESSFDAANMLKPYLAGGHIRFIGATTFEEYKKHFEKNKSLVRRFQNVEIKEPSEEDTVKILKGLKDKYEKFHGVVYEEGVMEYAVAMSVKHINERYLPDKALDLIDEAGAYRKLHPTRNMRDFYELLNYDLNMAAGLEEQAERLKLSEPHKDSRQKVDKELIAKVLSKICRIPIENVEAEDTDKLKSLDDKLKGVIFGQDEAIDQVVNAIKFSSAGLLEDNKPLASLLFVGPTGVGKTEVARSLAKELGVKLIRFDMSEYGEKHAVAKLIGSPAGYVGYEEGGLLTEEIRKNPMSVLLLDEIEKAHPDIYSILLQVMDYATLTDNQGRKADFRNVVVIMTSNAGANRIGKKGIGFQSGYQDDSVLMEEVKRVFQPEFRNRLNKVVVFNAMDDEMGSRIVDKKLKELALMLEKKKIALEVDEAARELIKERGISHEFGAREVDRVIRNDIKPLFVDEILFGQLKDGGSLVLKAEEGEFVAEALGDLSKTSV